MSARRSSRPSYDVMFYLPSVTPLLLPASGLTAGGAETQIVLLTRALARRGARACLIAHSSDEVLPSAVDGVDIIVRPVCEARQRLIGKLREAVVIWRLLAGVDTRSLVIRVAGPRVGLAAVSARLLRRNFVYSSASYLDFEPGSLGLKRRDRALYRLGLRLASKIVVQTQEQAELCERKLGRSPIVIRSIAEAAPERTSPPEAFLWLGRVDQNKQPLVFVELARALPSSLFRMIPVPGPGNQRLMDEVRGSAASLPNLELLRPMPRGEALDLVERAIAVVNTSEYEGMPNTFLEGWARGVPALSLSHDPDGVIKRYGLGEFADGSFDDFVAGARALWEGRHDAAAVAERCRRYTALEHSEDVVVAEWERVLDIPQSATLSVVSIATAERATTAGALSKRD